MGLKDDCYKYFGSDNLYDILGVKKGSKDNEIKSAYRKASLKVHPDRCPEDKDKEVAKRAFQTLSKVHFILSDKNLRQTYDETAIIPNEDSIESKADWFEYWRLLFPKITTKDIDLFLKKYIDSEDEKKDLKKVYLRFEGDLDFISESVIGFDEIRTRQLIQQLIADKEVPEFDAFVNESKTKREKRIKKAVKESKIAEKEAKKLKSGSVDDQLVMAIRGRAQNGFDDMIANLEAKYATNDSNKSKNCRKKSKK